MRIRLPPLVLVPALTLLLVPALALVAESPVHGPRKLTLVFNGDNGGEIAPCG